MLCIFLLLGYNPERLPLGKLSRSTILKVNYVILMPYYVREK